METEQQGNTKEIEQQETEQHGNRTTWKQNNMETEQQETEQHGNRTTRNRTTWK